MIFSLIVCTHKRKDAILKLLLSVENQSIYPEEILVIDGSPDDETKNMLIDKKFKNLKYFQIQPEQRGLTKQRNIGISKVDLKSEIVCFLDDDTILKKDYFEKLLETYIFYPEALGVGGYISNEIKWHKLDEGYIRSDKDFIYDGWRREDGKRFIWRKKLGLDSDCAPGFSPLFSHGRSIGFLPPSGKIYAAEQLMGGVSSFKSEVLEKHKFSEYFEGYGLYEDADFCLRVAKTGNLYVNTTAQLEHNHDSGGRPNMFVYGKMVVRNGWYVWRVKNPNPSNNDIIKWNTITGLLLVIRFINIFTTKERKEAFTETSGRLIGWLGLLLSKPTVK